MYGCDFAMDCALLQVEGDPPFVADGGPKAAKTCVRLWPNLEHYPAFERASGGVS